MFGGVWYCFVVIVVRDTESEFVSFVVVGTGTRLI